MGGNNHIVQLAVRAKNCLVGSAGFKPSSLALAISLVTGFSLPLSAHAVAQQMTTAPSAEQSANQQADDRPKPLRAGPWIPPEMLEAFEKEVRAQRLRQLQQEQQNDQVRIDRLDDLSGQALERQVPVGLYPSSTVGLAEDIWLNTDPLIITTIFSKIPQSSTSVVLNRWLEHLRLAEFDLADDVSRRAYFFERMAQLRGVGDVESMSKFISQAETISELMDDPRLLWWQMEIDLYHNDVPAACDTVGRYQSSLFTAPAEPQWYPILALCAAVNANRLMVEEYGQRLLEQDPTQQSFVALMMELLIRAEGGVPSQERLDLSGLKSDPISYSALRLLSEPIAPVFVLNADLLTKRMLLRSSMLADNDRLNLAYNLYANGVISTSMIQDFYQVFGEMALRDGYDGINQAPVFMAGDHWQYAPLYYRLTRLNEETSEQRIQLINQIWSHEGDENSPHSLMPITAFADYVRQIPISRDHIAAVRSYVRIALLVGDDDLARDWYLLANQMAQLGNGSAVKAVVDLWPLMLASGAQEGAMFADHILNMWQQGLKEDPKRLEKMSGLYAMLEALGYPMAEKRWLDILDDDVSVQGRTPSIGLWRRLMIASAHQRQGEVLSIALAALNESGPEGMDASAMSAIVHGLKNVGLEKIARQFAYEYLLTLGL